MNQIIITVHDKVAGTWTSPVVAHNAESAKRDFFTACNAKGSLIASHPADFEVYAIGEWSVPYDETKVPTLSVFQNFKFLAAGAAKEDANG